MTYVKQLDHDLETPCPDSGEEHNIVCCVFMKQWKAFSGWCRYCMFDQKEVAPKMTHSEHIVECCLAPIFLPFYIVFLTCTVVGGFVASLFLLLFSCALCCLGRDDSDPPLGCVSFMLALACCVPLMGCILALFVWPFGIVYYSVTRCFL